MRRRMVYFVTGLALISFIFTGCARRKEPEEKKVVAKVKRGAQLTPARQARPATPAERPTPSDKPITEERVLFSFERNLDGWEIPDWALEKDDHVAKDIEISKDVADEGSASLKVNCDFPGNRWTAALIELEQYLDFTPYREIVVDVYIPEDAPLGLRGKIILTVGESWKFTEMTRAIPLVPGEWVTIKASIEPGSYDWKRTVPDESFREDVRKIVVRVESNRKPAYKGPVYIDNIRICK